MHKARDVSSNEWRKIITLPAGRHCGQPCVRGLRVTVADVLAYLAAGLSPDQIVDDLPSLTIGDIRACLAFAADRQRYVMIDTR